MIKIREFKGEEDRNENETLNASSSSSSSSSSKIQEYLISKKEGIVVSSTLLNKTSTRFPFQFKDVQKVLSDLFLPLGYPDSVEQSYFKYQLYDSLQGLCSYLRGVVTTSAVLSAAGVGKSEVTAISAAVTWALRDGVGMMGGLLFSYFSASHFDSHVKEFRLFADIINDVGLTLDMITPFFSMEQMLYISALATVCKVMCGMAAGATKASITAHFAIRGNMADLNAKESTQETLVNIIGMILGVSLAKYMNHLEPVSARKWIWFVFITLTGIHVWANYKGVMLLRLNTLNRQRTEEILKQMIIRFSNQMDQVLEKMKDENSNMNPSKKKDLFANVSLSLDDGVPLSPNHVYESILESMKKLLFPDQIRLGVRFSELCYSMSGDDAIWLIHEFANDAYILGIDTIRNRICVVLKRHAKANNELEALTHAILVDHYMKRKQQVDQNIVADVIHYKNIIQVSHSFIQCIFGHGDGVIHKSSDGIDIFKNVFSIDKLSECGWNCERLYLGFDDYRIDCQMKVE